VDDQSKQGVKVSQLASDDARSMLARRMDQLDLTSAAVAARMSRASDGAVRPDASLVWRWAKGLTRPGQRYLQVLAAVLDLEEDMVRADLQEIFERRRQAAQNDPSPRGMPAQPSGQAELTALRDAREHMKRRALLQAAVIAVVESAILPSGDDSMRLAAVAGKEGVSRASLEALAIHVEHYMCRFRDYPLPEIEVALRPYLASVTRLLGGPLSYTQRGELCLRAAQISGLLGRVTFNLGRFREARLHFSNSFELANEIGHQPLMAWVVAEESVMALYLGQTEAAIGLTNYATSSHIGKANLAHLLSNEARAYSRIGDRGAAIRAIDRTERVIDRIEREDDSDVPLTPLFAFGRSAALHRIASTWISLGEPRRARDAAVAAIEITGFGGNSINRVHAQLALAASHAQQGDLEQSCHVALDALGSNPRNAYEVISRSVELLEILHTHSEQPDVQALHECLAHYKRKSLPEIN
jgi:tetratricopeptide (TPR) repeat protein